MSMEFPHRIPAQAGLGLLLTAMLLFAAPIFAQQPAAASAEPGASTPWQPRIHFYSPPNWINDPNGPILLNGEYNLFYQFNPFGDQWGHMSWGHAVSSDLIHWKLLPVALPEEKGVAIFSGSTVEDRDNTSGLCDEPGRKTPGCLIAIYTGASQDRQNQNIAVSRDGGATWTKYSSNPVIDLGLKDFRDPKVFWHASSQSWVMAVSLPTRTRSAFTAPKISSNGNWPANSAPRALSLASGSALTSSNSRSATPREACFQPLASQRQSQSRRSGRRFSRPILHRPVRRLSLHRGPSRIRASLG